MNRCTQRWLPWLALLLLCCTSTPLWAADCSISATAVNFGNYDPVSGSVATANGTVTVSCTYTTLGDLFGGFNVTTSLSVGSSGNFLNRTLKKGTENLLYNLYTNPGYSIVFGNGTGATSTFQICYAGYFATCGGAASGSNGSPFAVTVYGRIPASQDISVGVYSDSIVATITF